MRNHYFSMEKNYFMSSRKEKQMGFFNELFGENSNGPRDYDRVDHNSDGTTFYGYNDETGHTDWYNENNELDSRTETPDEDDC